MKILAIRGKNLASLAGAFEVDFQTEPLASTGLFAISGPTGAGKSTLLDALCLALFDDTPRLRTAEGRGIELPDVGSEKTLPNDRRNILRRGCAEGYAEVDFRGNDGIDYRARWSVRRAHGKAQGKLQQSEMSLMRIEDLQAVTGRLKSEVQRAIAERIGLSFEQFTRAVLLAQNEFFTFLKAGEDERAALLQTLTGTDRFEVLSRRAFERNKQEQEKLKGLQAQLEQQKPLTAEERTQFEQERATTRSALSERETQDKQLGAQLRWHQELARASEREAEAQTLLGQAIAQREAAGERRSGLARVEAVQAARALLADTDRLEKERDDVARQARLVEAAVSEAKTRDGAARIAHDTARTSLAAMEAERERFKPLIDQARQLDTEIAALAPSHMKAVKADQEAASALTNAQEDVRKNEKARATATSELTSTQEWLARHAQVAPLAEGWIKWGGLLENAAEERRTLLAAQANVASLTLKARKEEKVLADARTELSAAATLLAEKDMDLSTAAGALDRFDLEALARSKAELDARQQSLQSAEQAWRDACSIRAQADEIARQCDALRGTVASNQQRVAQFQVLQPAAEAAFAEAERAWKVVFDATQASVEALRVQLRPEEPCPVCGSHDHPYVARHTAFDQALTQLSENRERCRKAVNELLVEEQALARDSTSRNKQLGELAPRLDALRQQLAAAQRAWNTAETGLREQFPQHALPVDAGEGDAVSVWLAARGTEVRNARDVITASENDYRAAQAKLQTAQRSQKDSDAAHRKAHDAATQHQSAADKTTAALQAAIDTRTQGDTRLAALLVQLDTAHPEHFDGNRDWRARWQADPQAYYASCQQSVETWEARKNAAVVLQADISKLETEVTGLQRLMEQARSQHEKTSAILTELRHDLEARRHARSGVFVGMRVPAETGAAEGASAEPMTVVDVEAAFARALESAKQGLDGCERAAREAEQHHVRQQSALAELIKQQTSLTASAHIAAATQDAWLAEFNRQSADGTPIDLATLRQLLSHDQAWIATEREALQQFESAIAAARGGHQKLQQLRETHERSRPLLDLPVVDAPAALQTALDDALAEIASLRDKLGGFDLALHRDDEIRQHSAKLVEEIDAQTQAARIWWQMNELIGAADGKKFRNYAQQLTLDILLAYANAHLKDLARRYRLERVPNSLALMVVDQDMGDEQRSVHSLSGGESFLVSLALALGLASLSSHRVQVESLFIDEGFGSLDSDTLRMAMDALDSLQSMGRKVGVISHVQEMTERIGTRIQVKRLTGGQSQVLVTNAFLD